MCQAGSTLKEKKSKSIDGKEENVKKKGRKKRRSKSNEGKKDLNGKWWPHWQKKVGKGRGTTGNK